MSEKKFMTRRQILCTIKDLARSQGFYAVLYKSLRRVQVEDPESFDSFMNHLVNQQFENPVDLVLFFEA